MPQMAPMSWLILFIFFTLVFIFSNLLNFYILNYTHMNTKKMKTNKINWKW